jgi:hypothetical protein
LARAAAPGSLALTASAPAKGRSISRTSERAICSGLTDTPGSRRGSTSGRYPTVMTISTTINATANAKSPFAIWASLGKKGAPAATPSSSSPTPKGSSRCSSRASSSAAAGMSTKLASKDRLTKRTLRSGAVISAILSPKPIASMLDTTKIIVAIGTACCSTAIMALTSLPWAPIRYCPHWRVGSNLSGRLDDWAAAMGIWTAAATVLY